MNTSVDLEIGMLEILEAVGEILILNPTGSSYVVKK